MAISKYNPEGYFDPTPHEALTNIEVEHRAARLAKEAEVGELWLTHYSPSLNHPEEFLEDARAIFPRTVTARDGRTMELVFSEDE